MQTDGQTLIITNIVMPTLKNKQTDKHSVLQTYTFTDRHTNKNLFRLDKSEDLYFSQTDRRDYDKANH